MIKRITIITGIVTVFLCAVSCGSDWSEKLGDGYVYVEEGREWNFILGPILNIPPNIISYSFDDDYIVATQMPLPSNLLNYYHSAFEDFIYPEGITDNALWNHYYAEKVSADKIVSFSHILDKYGIEEITINQRDFRIIAKQTLLRLPFSFPDD